jgi:hypothetical protein
MSLPIRRTQAAPWLKDGLWRKAQAVPSLDLRFADNKSLVDAVSGQNLITFTRASSATYTDSTGTLQTATTNAPRFDHNPLTGESLGLLVEEQRTNLLLNSATLATQSVTVTAVAHTLSFYGTGTVTLSGTSTAGPAVGSGAFPARTTLTFTPAAGLLTLTVSGSVTSAQLEAGSFSTSYIPTTTAATTRAADLATITGSNFSSWYNQPEGSFFCSTFAPKGIVIFGTGDTFDNTQYVTAAASNNASIRSGGSSQASLTAPVSSSANTNIALSYALDSFAAVSNGGTISTDTSGAVPLAQVRLKLGSSAWDLSASNVLNGTIRRLAYFPARLPNTALQRMTQ